MLIKKKWPNGKRKIIKYSGTYHLKDLLKKYITPCGSTVVKINNSKILRKLRFSSRYRANDILFYLNAVKHFNSFDCCSEVVLEYKIGNADSLSGKKFKMIYYRFMAYKDFGLSNCKSLFLTLNYIILGIRKYYFKHSI